MADEPHVLHVIPGLRVGGAEAMLARLAEALVPEGWRFTVACLLGDGPLGPRLRQAGSSVVDLGGAAPHRAPLALWRLARLWRTTRPDLVVGWLYHGNAMTALARPFVPATPLVWTLRSSRMAPDDLSASARLALAINRRFGHLPDLVLANAHAGLAEHVADGLRPRAARVIGNGFDTGRLRPDAGARARLGAMLGVPEGRVLVGHAARVDPMKDHDGLIAATARAVAAGADLHLVLIGRGTRALAVPPALAGRVSLLGERADVPDLLPGLDLFCLPSAYGEGFPNALGEAMACGVPAIVTNVGDSAVVLGDAGQVVPPRDPDALAAALAAMADLPPQARAGLGVTARARILARHRIETVARQHGDLWRALATGAPLPPADA